MLANIDPNMFAGLNPKMMSGLHPRMLASMDPKMLDSMDIDPKMLMMQFMKDSPRSRLLLNKEKGADAEKGNIPTQRDVEHGNL